MAGLRIRSVSRRPLLVGTRLPDYPEPRGSLEPDACRDRGRLHNLRDADNQADNRPRKAGVSGVGDQRGDKAVQAMVRYWCANATVESPVREALGYERSLSLFRQSATSRPDRDRGRVFLQRASGFTLAHLLAHAFSRDSFVQTTHHDQEACGTRRIGSRWLQDLNAVPLTLLIAARWLPSRLGQRERRALATI
jgi:hypothetical protein